MSSSSISMLQGRLNNLQVYTSFEFRSSSGARRIINSLIYRKPSECDPSISCKTIKLKLKNKEEIFSYYIRISGPTVVLDS